MADKIYIGSGKTKTFDSGNTVLNASICLTDIRDNAAEFIREASNGKKYLNITQYRSAGSLTHTATLTASALTHGSRSLKTKRMVYRFEHTTRQR